MSTLSLKRINKIYPNNVQAVFDFNLDIQDKEFIVFVGPSGCGKSTTLRMVAGLEEITSGELYIDGKLVNDVAPKDRDIAMVFQSYALYPHMTVYDNMAFALKLRKIPMPLYTEGEGTEALKEANKELWKKAHAINRRFKKKQNDLDILPEREAVYNQIFENLDKMKALQTPVIGKDEYKIAIDKKAVEKLNNEINKLESYKTSKKAADPEFVKVLEDGIAQRQEQIKKVEAEIEYLENNDTQLTKLRHLTKAEIEVEVNKVAANIDLVRYLFRKPAALSGGQRQRVALGRSIVRKPKVFLMDEPLSNLDAKLRVQTRSEIIKIHERVGATTIYVTHDQTEAMTMADRIVIMKDGWVQQIGSPEEVYNDPANTFVGGFIGAPAMNFINVHLNKNVLKVVPAEGNEEKPLEIKVPKAYQKMLAPYEDKDLILGARPEALYIAGDANNENPSKPMDLVCDYAELLGYELILYTYINGQKVIVKTDVKNRVKTHDNFSVCFDEEKMYFFDKESTLRIR